MIAPAIDGIPELIVDGKTGFLLMPADPVYIPRTPGAGAIPKKVLVNGKLVSPRSLVPQQVADKILYLINHPEKRKAIGMAARKSMEQHFCLQRYIQELEQTYVALAKNVGQ